MMTRLGRTASKAFESEALEISWIDFNRTRGSKSRLAGTTGVPFYTNPEEGLAIPGKDKIKGAKSSMVGMACPFFGASTPEATGDSIISSITTEVGGPSILITRGTLQWHSRKYSSQSFLDPIDIAL